MTINLGINSDGIKYEVALEILGQERQPMMEAIRLENAKATPCIALVQYFQARLTALDELQGNLKPSDLDAVELILDKENRLIRG